MANYHSGRRLEWAIRESYQTQGYMVIRAAGSKSPFDIVAINDDEIILIQAKYGRKPSVVRPIKDGKRNLIYRLLWKPRNGSILNITPEDSDD